MAKCSAVATVVCELPFSTSIHSTSIRPAQHLASHCHTTAATKPLCAHAVCLLCSEELQQVVRDLERLYIEASRCLNLSGSALTAAAIPQGPEPSLLHIVETMQDTW